jgi:hypothetical protein
MTHECFDEWGDSFPCEYCEFHDIYYKELGFGCPRCEQLAEEMAYEEETNELT